MVTAKAPAASPDPAGSPWAGIIDKLQTATLGEFQIIRELGRGGMATVFLAHDIHLDRKVAIKVMSPLLASDDRMVERFRREAKTGAGLKHPNISTVHRVLEGEGLYFFVMDFVRGRPLDAILHRNGTLSVSVTRALLHQIGSGLAYAHRRKIYHRDVKPANVLISAGDGSAVVTDFGIAKVAEATTQTQTGAVVGTPAYMAPEQIYGREITGAVDQYALGIMAFEMLTGSPPFVGTAYVVMHAHTELVPPSVRETRPDCPPEMAEAIARMLAKDPTQRWPSLPHALAAMGAMMMGEDDPIRDELIRLATPDEMETARFATNTPLSPVPPSASRAATVAMVAISPPPALVEVRDSFVLVASARDVRGDEIPGMPIEWATNNSSVLSVQSDGTVTALAAGSAEISATAARARGAILVTVEPGRVAGLQLSIPPGALMAGDRIQLAARVVDKHRRSLGYTVQWGVGDPNIARVTPEGVLEARSAGSVDVFAESNGIRSVARVQIAPPAVAAVQLAFDPQRPVVGDRIRVAATPIDANGRPMRDRVVGWSLSDLSLATIVSDGVYEATAQGTLRITAASEGKAATVEIPIGPAPVASIRVSSAPAHVVAGTAFKLTGVALDARGNALTGPRITWSCSDTTIATASDDGTISARSAGDVRIVASCEGKAASVAVSIQAPAVAAVKITGLPPVVHLKTPFRLGVTVIDVGGQPLSKSVDWRSSDASVVSITPGGQVTPESVGRARVIAVVEGVEASANIDVVAPPIPVVLNRQPTVSAPVANYSPSPFVEPHRSVPPRPISVSAATGRNRLLVGAGVAAVVAIVASIAVSNRPGTRPIVLPLDSAVAQTPVLVTPDPKAEPQATPTRRDSNPAATAPPTTPLATTTKPAAPAPEPGVFNVSVSALPAMRVGETATLRASLERTAGTGPAPRVVWESSRPSILRIDRTTGVLIALDEGQATVSAIAGGARTGIPVTVLPALVASTPPQRSTSAYPPAEPTPPVRDPRPTAASGDEARAKAADALRESANGMVAALRAKDVALVAQMLAEGQNPDAPDMLKTVREGYGFSASMVQVSGPQMTDRSGTLDYQVKVTWVSAAGPTRARTVNMRAEVERSGTAWSAVRHRVVSGWR